MYGKYPLGKGPSGRCPTGLQGRFGGFKPWDEKGMFRVLGLGGPNELPVVRRGNIGLYSFRESGEPNGKEHGE